MESFDDDITVIQVREELLALSEPPALPFPLVRRKDGEDAGAAFLLRPARRVLH